MLRKAALALSGLFLAFLMIGLLLPSRVQVVRTIEIAASPERLFPLVDDLRAFQRWSPWQAPSMAVAFSGPQAGVGARMSWSDDGGAMSGSQTITASEPPRWVVYGLDFGPGSAAEASMELEPAATGTRLTWAFGYDIGYDIVGRYIGTLVKGQVESKYGEGLGRLKALAETGAATP